VKRAASAAYVTASGLALAGAFPTLDLWPLAWLAMVPFLVVVRGRRPLTAYGWGLLCGVVFYSATLYWIPATVSNYTRIGPGAAAGLLVLLAATIAALFSFAPCAALAEWLAASGISRIVAYPIVWVVLEWLRTFAIAGFPWASLGYSQVQVPPVAQLAELGGVYAISALLVFINAALAEVVHSGWGKHRRLAVAMSVVIVAVCSFGWLRLASLRSASEEGSLMVGLVQGNIPQAIKWDPRIQDQTIDVYLELSRRAADLGAKLIVWPEAAVPFLLERDPRSARLQSFAVETGTTLLVGAPGYENRDGRDVSFNQAWEITPEGKLVGPYDKMQLVPFGEYIPFFGLFGAVDVVVQSVGQFGRGKVPVVFDGPPIERADDSGQGRPARFGTLICYEGIFPALTRRFVERGADFLVNISNDAWYGRTSAPYQHIAMVALRAIETRVPIVRATNTGVTALIGIDGSVRRPTPLFERELVVDTVTIRPVRGIYTMIGDVFAYACILALAALVSIRLRLRSVLIR